MMKTLLLLLLTATAAFGQATFAGKATMGGAYTFTPAVAGGGFAGFFEETFEGTGGVYTWTTFGGGVGSYDLDYAASPLVGSQSLRLPGDDYIGLYATFTAQSVIYGKFVFRPQALSGGTAFVLRLATAADATRFSLRIDADGSGYVYNGTDWGDFPASTFSAATTYYVWFEYRTGTGANGVARVWMNTSDSKPGSPLRSVTTGDATTNPERVTVANGAADDIRLDQIQLHTEDF